MLEYDDGESPDVVYIQNATNQQVGLLHTPKRIPTLMVIALLSLGNNVFVDSLYEPTLEPSIRTFGSL